MMGLYFFEKNDPANTVDSGLSCTAANIFGCGTAKGEVKVVKCVVSTSR
jgi:hypothetical protein